MIPTPPYPSFRNFEQALEHCRDAQQEDMIREAEAESLFTKGQFESSARLFAQTGRSFEEVALRYVHVEARDALRIFLSTRLERTDPKKDLTQRVMLCTWLTEIYLDKLNSLKDSMGAAELYEECVQEFRHFLQTQQTYLQLNRDTTFELIASHGRTDELLFYADLSGEHERVIQHHLQRGNYDAALDALAQLTSPTLSASGESHEELYYKYSPILMRFAALVCLFVDLSGFECSHVRIC
jgi:hypothetical protein